MNVSVWGKKREMEVFFLFLTGPLGWCQQSRLWQLSLSTVNRKQILESEVCSGSLGDRKLDRHRTSLATVKHYDSHTNKKYSVRFLKFHNKTKEYSFLSIHRLFYRNETKQMKPKTKQQTLELSFSSDITNQKPLHEPHHSLLCTPLTAEKNLNTDREKNKT